MKAAYNALMEDVRLLPIRPELAGALRAGSGPLRQRYGALVAAEDSPIVRDVVEQTLLMPDYDDAGGWGGYLAVDRTSDLIVGSCAFKGSPTEDGTVEIAYYTFGPHEGQGHAKSMARALITTALSSHLVRRVIAHTLPEDNPSTSVLRSVGMGFVGEVHDPEDGPVWRWQLESGDASSRGPTSQTGASGHYAPECVEGVFSEVRIQHPECRTFSDRESRSLDGRGRRHNMLRSAVQPLRSAALYACCRACPSFT